MLTLCQRNAAYSSALNRGSNLRAATNSAMGPHSALAPFLSTHAVAPILSARARGDIGDEPQLNVRGGADCAALSIAVRATAGGMHARVAVTTRNKHTSTKTAARTRQPCGIAAEEAAASSSAALQRTEGAIALGVGGCAAGAAAGGVRCCGLRGAPSIHSAVSP